MRTNFLLAGFTLTALLSSGTAFGADPRLLNLVMPDAGTLAGANVTSAEISPFGQYVLAQITATANQDLQTFITATGFDPRYDVSEILAATSAGQTPGSTTTPAGLLLAIGNFQVTQMTAAITAKAPQLTVQNYGGATLISGTGQSGTGQATKPGFSAAFLGTTIAILGDTVSVKAAIDRSAGVNSINPALAVQVQALSTSEDAWAVTNTPVASLIPGGLGGSTPGSSPTGGATAPSPMSQFAQMFNSIQSSSGGIKFGATVQITGQAVTNDAGTAQSLAGILQALASIFSMAAGQDPQATAMAQILQGLKVTADGTAINLALSIPETQIESILNAMKNSQPKPAAKAAVRPAIAPLTAPGAVVKTN